MALFLPYGYIIFTILLLELGSSGGHQIVELIVPLLADPRENATLSCKYDMGEDRLYSTKWFKDDNEIYRYMPGVKPPGLPFPVKGVRLAKPPRCTRQNCDIELTDLSSKSAGVYKCEVSTEAPTFRIVNKNSRMTIAALPRKDPSIQGLNPRYDIGEEVRVNCTSDLSMPPANITWYINDLEASFLNLEGPWASAPDKLGLVRVSLGLRFVAERNHFSSGSLRLRCSSLLPNSVVGSPHRRQAIGIASMYQPAFLDKLAWLRSSASHRSIYLSLVLISLFVNFRFC